MKQIMDEEALLKIQDEALDFTKAKIGWDDWDTIYNLKRELLIAEANYKSMLADRNKQIERSEGRNAELNQQVEQLKMQIK